MFAYYYKFGKIPMQNLEKMRKLAIGIIAFLIINSLLLSYIFITVTFLPFEMEFTIVSIDVESYNRFVDQGYLMSFLTIPIIVVVWILYQRFRGLTKLKITQQQVKDEKTFKQIQSEIELDQVGVLRNQQYVLWALLASVIVTVLWLNYFPRRLQLFPSLITEQGVSILENQGEYITYRIIMAIFYMALFFVYFFLFLFMIKQIQDIDKQLMAHEQTEGETEEEEKRPLTFEERYEARKRKIAAKKEKLRQKKEAKLLKYIEEHEFTDLGTKLKVMEQKKALEKESLEDTEKRKGKKQSKKKKKEAKKEAKSFDFR